MVNPDLNAEMMNMINTFNKQRDSICDAECQRDNEIRDLVKRVNDTEENVENAPENLLDLQRELSTRDSQYKSVFDDNIKTMANTKVEKLQNEFNDTKLNILNNLNYYDTQLGYENSMNNLTTMQGNKLKKLNKTLAENEGITAVNRRMATFYSQEMDLIDWTSSYAIIIYWILFSIQLIAALVLFFKKPDTKHKGEIILGIFILLIFPLYDASSPFFRGITKMVSLFPTP